MPSPDNNLIDVWNIFLPDCTPLTAECTRLLNAKEKERAAAFHHPADASNFILARGILRRILGQTLATDPAAIRFEHNENGKPFLPESDLQFNLSHSRDRLLIAVASGRAVGIDIEFRRASVNMNAIADRWFSPEERQFFQSLSALSDGGVEGKNPQQEFFDIWAKKEAYVKARGLGIFQGLSEFTVPLGTCTKLPTLGKGGEWFFQPLEIDPAYAAALVAEAPAVPIILKTL